MEEDVRFGLPHELLEIARQKQAASAADLVALRRLPAGPRLRRHPASREPRARSRRRRGGRRHLGLLDRLPPGPGRAARRRRPGAARLCVRQHAPGGGPRRASSAPSELMVRSIRHVVERLEHWAAEHGEESGFRQVGSLKLALTDGRVRELEAHVANARRWGLEVELSRRPRRRVPACRSWTPRASRRRRGFPGTDTWSPTRWPWPSPAPPGASGGPLRDGAPGDRDPAVSAGAVRGVETPAGRVEAPRVIVAAGPWVRAGGGRRRAAGGHRAAAAPALDDRAHGRASRRACPVVRVPDASVYIRPEVGGLMLGGFEARPKAFSMADLPLTFEIEHTEKDLGVLEELAGGLTRAFPALGGAPVLKGCAGLPTFTPDGKYLLGAVPSVRGLWVAAGCNAIGIAGSLLVGEWLGELVLEGRTRDDTSSQALDRFGPRYGERRPAPRSLRVDLRQLLQPGQGRLLTWAGSGLTRGPGAPHQDRLHHRARRPSPRGSSSRWSRAGMDVARLNFSHGTHAEHLPGHRAHPVRGDQDRQAHRDPPGPPGAQDPPGDLCDGRRRACSGAARPFVLTTETVLGTAERASISYGGLRRRRQGRRPGADRRRPHRAGRRGRAGRGRPLPRRDGWRGPGPQGRQPPAHRAPTARS